MNLRVRFSQVLHISKCTIDFLVLLSFLPWIGYEIQFVFFSYRFSKMKIEIWTILSFFEVLPEIHALRPPKKVIDHNKSLE